MPPSRSPASPSRRPAPMTTPDRPPPWPSTPSPSYYGRATTEYVRTRRRLSHSPYYVSDRTRAAWSPSTVATSSATRRSRSTPRRKVLSANSSSTTRASLRLAPGAFTWHRGGGRLCGIFGMTTRRYNGFPGADRDCRHEGMKDLQCMSFTSKGASEIIVGGWQDTMFVIDVVKGEIVKQVGAPDLPLVSPVRRLHEGKGPYRTSLHHHEEKQVYMRRHSDRLRRSPRPYHV